MENLSKSENIHSDIIKKNSIKLFTVEKKIEEIITLTTDENHIKLLNNSIKMIRQIDKDLLSSFDIKLSNKEKNNAYNLMKLLK